MKIAKDGRNNLVYDVGKAAMDAIRSGDRVTIVNRFEQARTGRAVMRGPHGWVLNMGGAHGTPAIADERNIIRVTRAKGKN